MKSTFRVALKQVNSVKNLYTDQGEHFSFLVLESPISCLRGKFVAINNLCLFFLFGSFLLYEISASDSNNLGLKIT